MTRPTVTAMIPCSVHCRSPVIKLVGANATLKPCSIQMAPISVIRTPVTIPTRCIGRIVSASAAVASAPLFALSIDLCARCLRLTLPCLYSGHLSDVEEPINAHMSPTGEGIGDPLSASDKRIAR